MARRIYKAVLLTVFAVVMSVAGVVIYIRHDPGHVVVTGDYPVPLAVVIDEGDTFWGLAARYYPNELTGQMAHKIERMNPHLRAERLMPGQTVWLPQN